jgi:enoyl-CoA hydratase/carnithine racemase
MAETPHALIVEQDQIITVTFNRPEKLNPVSPQVTSVLWEAVNALGSRTDLRAMVITGRGRYFTAGLDMVVGHGDRLPGPDALGSDWRRGYRSHALLYDEMENIEKPVIVAANGPCLGAGMEMAMSCDFRFCTPEAHWGLPEVRSTGSIPGSGGVSRLTRLVGTHWTKWIAWAGRNVTAEQALAIGIVHEIYPAGELLDRVYEFAASLIAIDPEVTALSKLAIDLCDPQDREKVRNVERLVNTELSHRGAGRPATDYRGPPYLGQSRRRTS